METASDKMETASDKMETASDKMETGNGDSEWHARWTQRVSVK